MMNKFCWTRFLHSNSPLEGELEATLVAPVGGVKLLGIIVYFLSTNLYAAAVSNTDNKDNLYLTGVGLSLSRKYILTENMLFTEDVLSVQKAIDNVFINYELFGDYFLGSEPEMDYQYGVGFNFGYGYRDVDFTLGIGFVRAGFEYKDETETKDYERNSIYYGFGIAYNFSEKLALKLQGKTYEIEFDNSASDKVSLRNNNITLALGLNF